MFAIAQITGGDWPQLALEGYLHLTQQASTTVRVDLHPQSNGKPAVGETQDSPKPSDGPDLILLADIRQIFTQSGATRISSKQLLEALRTGPAGRYAKLGSPYSALSWLARGLQPFGIKSRVMRIGTQCAKGYDLADFTDAFARFLDP